MRTLLSPTAGVRLAVLLAIAGCHSEATGPRDISVTLAACGLGSTPATKTCPATSLLPLQFVEVTAVATPTGSFSIDRIVVRAQGVITAADTFVAQSPGPGVAVDTFFIPAVVGTVTFSATASGASASEPLTISTTATSAVTTPAVCHGLRRSPKIARARSAVLAG